MAAIKSKILNPRIKISRSGRAYVEVADLVRTRFARIEKSRQKSNGDSILRDAVGKVVEKNNKSNSGKR